MQSNIQHGFYYCPSGGLTPIISDVYHLWLDKYRWLPREFLNYIFRNIIKMWKIMNQLCSSSYSFQSYLTLKKWHSRLLSHKSHFQANYMKPLKKKKKKLTIWRNWTLLFHMSVTQSFLYCMSISIVLERDKIKLYFLGFNFGIIFRGKSHFRPYIFTLF